MDVKRYIVHSEKYNIWGEVQDWMFSLDLVFEYDGRNVQLALERPFPFSEEAIKENGKQVMETYIEKLQTNKKVERKTMLHYWYLTEVEQGGEKYLIAKGVVTGHKELTDSLSIHTSPVLDLIIDEATGEAIIKTNNTVYHCPLEYLRFERQDKAPQLILDYEKVKELYQGKIPYPTIEPDNVLLVLSNFDEYYFHSLYYQPEGEEEPLDYSGHAHIGTIQDSFLISTEDYRIDLRYFPHFQNIEFYSEDTDERPWYIENIGDVPLYAKTSKGTIRLAPGERKLVARENAEKDKPILPGGDLYPAAFIE